MVTLSEANNKGKLALKAGIWYVISSVMVKAIGVLTTPIFTRLLTTEQYGTVQTFISWQSLLIPFFTLNLPYSIGRAKLDFPDRLEEYSGAMQMLSMLVSAVLVGVVTVLLGTFSSLFELTKTETLLLMAYLFFTPTINLHQNKYKYTYRYKLNIAIAWYMAVGSTLVSLVMVWLAPAEQKGLMRILGMTLSHVALALFLWGRSLKKRTLKGNTAYWKYALKISVPLVFHTVCMHVLSQSDRIFITKIWGKTDTAFYSLAYTYGMALHALTTAAAEGWLPWFHDTYYAGGQAEIRQKVKPMVLLGCFVGLACVALAPEAVLLLGGKKYAHSTPCVPPVVMGVVCQYIYTHYVNIELHLKKTIYVSVGTMIAAGLNILLNAIFIPVYGFVAAAYTTLASYFVLMIIHFLITRLILKVRLYDDLFMFGVMIVTALISLGLTQLYAARTVRYVITAVGFALFLYCFRDYIGTWIRKIRKKMGGKEKTAAGFGNDKEK